MVKNDFEKLNSDDWLKKEIEREKRVSAWDFDDGRKVRYEHEENCDARNNASEHEIRHSRRRPVDPEKIENNLVSNNPSWFMIDLFLFIALIVFHAYLYRSYYYGGYSGAITFMAIMLLNPGVILYFILKKKVMPNLYYMITFITAIGIELFWIFTNLRFLLYVFRRY